MLWLFVLFFGAGIAMEAVLAPNSNLEPWMKRVTTIIFVLLAVMILWATRSMW